jgi:hypothetical protein
MGLVGAGFRGFLLGALLLAAGVSSADFPAGRMFQTVDLSQGVFAFISPETSGPVPSGNVLVVVGDDGSLSS